MVNRQANSGDWGDVVILIRAKILFIHVRVGTAWYQGQGPGTLVIDEWCFQEQT